MAVEQFKALDYTGVYYSSATMFQLIEDHYVPRATYISDMTSLDARIRVLEQNKGIVMNVNNNGEGD